MELSVGTFDLNNLFSRFTFSADLATAHLTDPAAPPLIESVTPTTNPLPPAAIEEGATITFNSGSVVTFSPFPPIAVG